MSYSYKSIVDGGADSDLVYYNVNIINTQQNDAGTPSDPPIVRFNESRDAPIIRDASLYDFSIIRFTMNGPNKTLPLFIPIIQTNGNPFANQQDPNRTIYYTTIPYQRSWSFTNTASPAAVQTKLFTVATDSTPVIYRPEIQNRLIAPIPSVPITGITRQNIGTRYYWVYTYKHWCDLVNEAFNLAMLTTYNVFKDTWTNDPDIDQGASPFPYPTYNDFLAAHDVPFIKYDESSKLFEIYGDTRAFNVSSQVNGAINSLTGLPVGTNPPLPAFVPPTPASVGDPAQAESAAYLRLFMNGNLYGLFSNFKNTLYNAITGGKIPFPLAPSVQVPTILTTLTPTLYTYEILFPNENYTNILNNNPTLQGNTAVPPPAYNPYFLIPPAKQNLYWISKQDYNSTNSLWTPVQSIVFTSTLLPTKNEYSGKPLLLGDSNTNTSAGSQAGFEPIIADFVVDQQSEKAEGWRDFTLYEPTAEYKMVSLTASHEEIRNIDVQVFWKYRLTGELIPLTMFNCSDVGIKMLFRKKQWK